MNEAIDERYFELGSVVISFSACECLLRCNLSLVLSEVAI